LDYAGRTEMGLGCGFRIVGIGVMEVILRESGKTPYLIHLLKGSGNHFEATVLASLRNLDGMS